MKPNETPHNLFDYSSKSARDIAFAAWLMIIGLFVYLILYSNLSAEFLVSENMMRIPDDAFYYMVPVNNFIQNGIVSFDGHTPTNGFHPLYFFVLIPLRFIAESDPFHFLKTALIWQSAITVLFCGLWFTIMSRRVSVLAGIFILPFMFFDDVDQLFINGLETHLAFLLLAICLMLFLLQKNPFSTRRNALALGAACGLAVLSRLDLIFFAFGFFLMSWFYFSREDGSKRNIVYSAALAFFCIAPYLLWNWICMGHFVPISGAVKAGFGWSNIHKDMPAHPFFISVAFVAISRLAVALVSWLSEEKAFVARLAKYLHLAVVEFVGLLFIWLALPPDKLAILPLCAFGLALTVLLILIKQENRDPNSIRNLGYFAIILCLYTLMQMTHELFFVSKYFAFWHLALFTFVFFVLTAEAIATTISEIASKFQIQPKKYFVALLLILIVASSAFIAVLEFSSFRSQIRGLEQGKVRTWQSSAFEAALWAKDHLPKKSLCAMHDAGVFAFFSGLPVINLDGVIMNYDFLQTLQTGKLGEYLEKRGLQYVLYKSVPEQTLEKDYRYRIKETPLWVSRNQEVYRSGLFDEGSGPVRFMIWKLPQAATKNN